MNHVMHRISTPRQNAFLLICDLLIASMLVAGGQTAHADGGGCPLTTVNSGVNACASLTATPTGVALTIDGNDTGGEWAGTPSKAFTGLVDPAFTGTIQFQKRSDGLYLFITLNDSSNQSQDRVELFFDPLHNHAGAADDIGFRIRRSNTNHERGAVSGGGITSPAPWTPGAALNVTNGPAQWRIEVRLTPADLGVPDIPPIVGFYFSAYDGNSNPAFWYDNGAAIATPALWANLKTRYPIEYSIVLDQSGSMLDQNKWTNAKRAANVLANTAAILRDATYFEDLFGIVTFASDCSTEANKTAIAKPLQVISSFPLGNYTDAPPALTDPIPNNCTPIGKGLDGGFGALGTMPEASQRVILLMSDGMHNSPGLQTPLQPNYLTYYPCPGNTSWAMACANTSLIQVSSVAFGEDWGVSTALLQDITNRYSGSLRNYNITNAADTLNEIFISSLDELYYVNTASVRIGGGAPIPPGTEPTGIGVPIPANDRKLLFIFTWENPAQATAIPNLQRQNGAVWDNVPCSASAADINVGFAMCRLDNPQAGTYRAPAPANTTSGQFVLRDLALRARYATDFTPHGTGRDMLLTVDINDGGVQASSAQGYDVTATVTRDKPDQGLGDFLTLTNPNDCRLIDRPTIPGLNDRFQAIVRRRLEALLSGELLKRPDEFSRINILYMPYGQLISPSPSPTGQQQSDPLAYQVMLAQGLFDKCNLKGLPRSSDPGLKLVDDGTNGDVTANDGVYSLKFPTENEGSYSFRFSVEGRTPSGEPFSGTKLVAEYVPVASDPAASSVDGRDVFTLQGWTVREYFVIPRSAKGKYLGPGHGDRVIFMASGLEQGTWLMPIIDYGNGVYSRMLAFLTDKEKPEVKIALPVGSVTPPDTKPGKDGTTPPRENCDEVCAALFAKAGIPLTTWVLVLAAIIGALVLIIVILLLSRRPTPPALRS